MKAVRCAMVVLLGFVASACDGLPGGAPEMFQGSWDFTTRDFCRAGVMTFDQSGGESPPQGKGGWTCNDYGDYGWTATITDRGTNDYGFRQVRVELSSTVDNPATIDMVVYLNNDKMWHPSTYPEIFKASRRP